MDGPTSTQVDFTVTLFPAMSSQVVTVQYATVNGTAVAGTDYLAAQGVLTFEPGQSTLTVPVTILGATAPAATKQFSLMLSNANPSGTPISIAQATATIINTVVIPPPQIIVNNISVNETASTATFNVLLSQASLVPVTVVYNTVDGTAVAGVDYQSTSGSLTFAAGQTLETIVVPIIDDPLYGPPTKSFGLQVNVTNASATPSSLEATATILETNSEPQISIQGASLVKPTSGKQQANFIVTLSVPAAWSPRSTSRPPISRPWQVPTTWRPRGF